MTLCFRYQTGAHVSTPTKFLLHLLLCQLIYKHMVQMVSLHCNHNLFVVSLPKKNATLALQKNKIMKWHRSVLEGGGGGGVAV